MDIDAGNVLSKAEIEARRAKVEAELGRLARSARVKLGFLVGILAITSIAFVTLGAGWALATAWASETRVVEATVLLVSVVGAVLFGQFRTFPRAVPFDLFSRTVLLALLGVSWWLLWEEITPSAEYVLASVAKLGFIISVTFVVAILAVKRRAAEAQKGETIEEVEALQSSPDSDCVDGDAA